MKRIRIVGAVVIAAAVFAVTGCLFTQQSADAQLLASTRSKLTLADIPFDGAKSYEYLKQLCALGPRPSGSAAMTAQQQLLIEHFQGQGGTVSLQSFRARNPRTGAGVDMNNLIIAWHPERGERILLVAHYDTRPLPSRDPKNPQGIFLGANDGASGTALLMELGRHMPELKGKLGVDFLLVDGEELVYDEQDPYFLGSEYFARAYAEQPPPYRYRWGVVLDMIGDADLQIKQEPQSAEWRDTRSLVQKIWETAKRLGVREFVFKKGVAVRDDHLPLHDVAKIPTIDLIDFDYPAWHTTKDVPDQCSALSLAKVGWVMHEWLKGAVVK